MSHVRIRRELKWLPVVVSTDASSSTTIRTNNAAGAVVEIADRDTTATRVAVFGSTDDTSYRAVYGSDGVAAEIVLGSATSAAYALPDAAYGCSFVRLVADADLGTAAVCTVSVKS